MPELPEQETSGLGLLYGCLKWGEIHDHFINCLNSNRIAGIGTMPELPEDETSFHCLLQQDVTQHCV